MAWGKRNTTCPAAKFSLTPSREARDVPSETGHLPLHQRGRVVN
jgi:hypothetical protein